MSQDIIADALNQIMNAKRAGKQELVVARYSKLLLNLLEVAKKQGYIEDFKTQGTKLEIKFSETLNECRAIKPRYNIQTNEIDNKVRRFLPAKNFGILIISTSKGLITNIQAYEQGMGGQLLAYFY